MESDIETEGLLNICANLGFMLFVIECVASWFHALFFFSSFSKLIGIDAAVGAGTGWECSTR